MAQEPPEQKKDQNCADAAAAQLLGAPASCQTAQEFAQRRPAFRFSVSSPRSSRSAQYSPSLEADSMLTIHVDWHTAFIPTVHLGELFMRGSIVYLFLFFAFRILPRQAGAVGVSDLLALVLIADAAQNAMSADYHSVPEGLVLVSTILFWDVALDWLAFKVPPLRKVLHGQPLPLIIRGRLQQLNLDKQLISEEELDSHLRQHGVADPREVVLCNLEGDGHISVLQGESKEDSSQERARGLT